MSWLLNLYETYQANEKQVGRFETKQKEQEFTLLPVAHTTQTAHIEVQITESGEYHSAAVITDKHDMITLIPSTEQSASRAGKVIAPYPLHDKLSYVAGDFVDYGGDSQKREQYNHYIRALKQWAESPHAHPKIKSIYTYLSKGRLVQDLLQDRILFADENHRLIDKWDKKYETESGSKPLLFTVLAGEQESAFIRFNVYTSSEDVLTKVWRDPEVYDSFIRFYSEQLGDVDLCYVTGTHLPSTERHANKIRHSGDKAKLISANDNSGFTFRGRFSASKDAANISYDVSQKAHNALKWLINRQGKIIDNRVFLVWGSDSDVPDPDEDYYTLDPTPVEPEQFSAFTNQEFAREVAKAIDGYRGKLNTEAKVNIMILDSATTGRMAVLYYRNMDKQLYLDRLVQWHSTCVWLHRYRKDQQTGKFVNFFGAPATQDIAYAAYGLRAGDKVIKGLRERMLPCILDGRSIPLDIVRSVYNRATRPESMEKWEWEKTLSIACALINKRFNDRQEGFNVALDTENRDRSYLFGRLLALADVLERQALGDEENRASNAIRYMHAFSRHPARTWRTIQDALLPYQARLGTKATRLNKLIDEVGAMIKIEDFNNKPLSEKYLLGFYSQRHDWYQPRKTKQEAETESSNP